MSEPITPKAEQHVVEGEFVEAPNKAEAAKDEKAPGKPIAWPQPLGLWLAVMLVSGAALALALSSWVTLQRPDPSAQLAQQLSHQVEQQQTQIQQLEQALAAQQQQQQKLEEAWASVSQALETLSAQAQTPTESAASSSDTQPFEQALAQWQSEVSARLNQLNEALANGAATGQTQADIARFEQDVAQQVAQLKAQLEQLNQNQQAWVEEWGPKIRSLGEHLNGLAQAQAQWIERLKPQIEEAVTEIQPQLDGFFSRFNQLFTIHKHEAQSAPAESAQ